jgi:hypothetical protein
MKVIYSSFLGFSKKLVSVSSLEMAKISNFLLQKDGYETIFVGDDKSIQEYGETPYNQILRMDDRIYDVPKCMWSAGKLLALTTINEPSVHIDFDLFCFQGLNRPKLEKDIICLHTEKNLDDRWDYLYKAYQDVAPDNTSNYKPSSYNCAIIGGLDFNLIKKCANDLIEHIIKYKQEIEEKFIEVTEFIETQGEAFRRKYGFFNIPAVLLEQIWMFQLYKHYNKNIATYLDGNPCIDSTKACLLNVQSIDKGIVHFQGNKENPASRFAIKKLNKIFKL